MKGDSSLDPVNLTFSQAYGFEELPRPLKLGEMDRESRVKLWNQFYHHMVSTIDDDTGLFLDEEYAAREVFRFLQANVDQDEAVFMLGACASFSSYLARKHQRQAP